MLVLAKDGKHQKMSLFVSDGEMHTLTVGFAKESTMFMKIDNESKSFSEFEGRGLILQFLTIGKLKCGQPRFSGPH